MSLSFANPLLAWGLLAALLPVVIHLFFRKRPRPTPFPAIDFILRARRETERRLKLRRACGESDVDYVLCRTDRPPDEVLLPFLWRRERSAA